MGSSDGWWLLVKNYSVNDEPFKLSYTKRFHVSTEHKSTVNWILAGLWESGRIFKLLGMNGSERNNFAMEPRGGIT